MNRATLLLAVAACAIAAYALLRPAHHQGVTSCAQLVHQQVKSAVEVNGLKYVKESLWACHQDGDTAVARVRVWFDQIQYDPWSGKFTPARQSVVLVMKFVKSPWQLVTFKAASETR